MKKSCKLFAAIFILTVVLAVAASAVQLPFDDVPEDAWYYDTVAEAYETGIMTGPSATTFAPMGTMSRSQFVTLLYRITGVTDGGFGEALSKFGDGVTDEWYSEAMGWGVTRGLIKGMDDNTVRPAQTITRAELAVMIVRYLEYRSITLADTVEEAEFTDDEKIADWAREQIYTCQRLGIFKGDADGRFNPAGEASRAEGATIILRLLDAVECHTLSEGIVIARTGETSPYKVVYMFGASGNDDDVTYTLERVKQELDMSFAKKPYMKKELTDTTLQFVFNVDGYPEIDEMKRGMGNDAYAVKVVRDGEYTKVLFAYTSVFARSYAVEYLLTKYVKDGVFALPADLDLKGTKSVEDFIHIDSSINRNTRDPFIYGENGVYYAYITGWRVYKNTSGRLDGKWTEVKNAVVKPGDYDANPYAPEVYKYGGKYYMFTAYKPEKKLNKYDNRGCIIMAADSPEGPFRMITGGWITPKEWDCIDGTLYVDPDGQPWMIFSREHTCYDGNGGFYAAKLSDDFTHFISEPMELFRGMDAKWAWDGVTDGCFMYTGADGELQMLWSNSEQLGYCVAVSQSSNGRLDGEWIHSIPTLYTANSTGFDGGHGMIFTDFDGQMYLVYHSPNDWKGDSSRMSMLPIIERNGMLVWDLNLD
ncbi:MAG: S-layer homology domain-containing protein [Clostridia bacterium]|nr:S-layer homology domain-containing protein [Clostridia bacterium]